LLLLLLIPSPAVSCCAQDPTASLETLLKALPDGSAPKATYMKGDKVEVIAGDLTSLTGVCACVG
jgi:hypothetical protein